MEAVLFAAPAPLSPEAIRLHAGEGDLGAALAELAGHYAGRGVELVERGGHWLFQTAPDLSALMARLVDRPRRLGRAARETLAIIAYHQPVSRAEIEELRGVQTSPGTLDQLMAAGFVRLAGRRESPGRPLLFATTPAFLAHFGLTSLADLPSESELRQAGLLDPGGRAFEGSKGGHGDGGALEGQSVGSDRPGGR